MVLVKFFASLRDQTGIAEIQVDTETGLTARDIWERAVNIVLPDNILVAVNQEYASLDTSIEDRDEVAFFPPVTGG